MTGHKLLFTIFCLILPQLIIAGTADLVTYGSRAPGREGDEDHVQVVFFSMPQSWDKPLHLRIFDADCGGLRDHVTGLPDTRTRFVLMGKVFAEPDRLLPFPEREEPGPHTPLADETYGVNPALDHAWHNFKTFRVNQGEAVGDRRYFKLVVIGKDGDDANAYRVTLSTRQDRNAPPKGLEIFSYAPTFRLDKPTSAQMIFTTNVRELTVSNFDAAGARVTLETAYRTLPLPSSGQGESVEAQAVLDDLEADLPIAVVLHAEGGELPNDTSFRITGPNGAPIAIDLPVLETIANHRPNIRVKTRSLANCNAVAFDAGTTEDQDGDELQFRWILGDGNTMEGPSFTHQYPGPGAYQVRLIVTDASGQAGNGSTTTFPVIVNKPPEAEAGPPVIGVPGRPIAFDASASHDLDGQVTRWTWDFEDGATAEGEQVNHTYARPGRYNVSLLIEDDSAVPCNHHTDTRQVWVNAKPVAEAGEDIFIAAGREVVLDGSNSYDSDGKLVTWTWDFGDGETANIPTATHQWREPGVYQARLTVSDDAGVSNSQTSDALTVRVNHIPVAEAGENRAVGVGQLTVFNGSASTDKDGRVARYDWDFGDGNRGRGRQARYAFEQPGTYTVTLTVHDDFPGGSQSHSDTLTVVVNARPTANAGPDQTVTTSRVQFNGAQSRDPDGGVLDYLWEFGDGASGTGPRPVHVYAKPGRYRVILTVTDDSQTENHQSMDHMEVFINRRPAADAGPDRVAAPGETLDFDAYGSFDFDGEITRYLWEMGDGAKKEGVRVSHAYQQPGVYRVRLTVTDETGNREALDFHEALVKVNRRPTAVAGPDILAAPGDLIRFDADSSSDRDGRIVAVEWAFSDGLFGEEMSHQRTFKEPGVYTVTLTVYDDSGADNGQHKDEAVIHINHRPTANPGPPIFTCEDSLIFDGRSSLDPDGDALTYHWDFGDGTRASGEVVRHQFPEGGIYPVVLTVDDGTGLANARHSKETIITINRAPEAEAGEDITVCAGDIAVFNGADSFDPDGDLLRYRWEFEDGMVSEQTSPTRIFKKGGLYKVALYVEDDSGLSCNHDTDTLVVRVVESPVARAGEDVTVCANSKVRFDGSQSSDTDGVVNRFHWDFGDGREGGGPTPEHSYTKPGRYDVVLTVTGDRAGDCDNTNTDNLVVTVRRSPDLEILGEDVVPQSAPVVYKPALSGLDGAEPESWSWKVDDVEISKEATLDHRFEKWGVYTLSLTVTTIQTAGERDPCGTVTAKRVITVNRAPEAVAGDNRITGVDELVVFNGSASKDLDGKITDYHWDFGDGETGSGLEVRHRYKKSGSYTALLRVTDNTSVANNTGEHTVDVVVNTPPLPRIDAPAAACVNEPVTLSAGASQDQDGNPLTAQWLFGDGGQGEGLEVTHTYARTGRFHVTLTVDDGTGVNNSRVQTTLEVAVNVPPHVEAGPERVVCSGTAETWDGSASSDEDGTITRHLWDFGDGGQAEGVQVSYVYDQPGQYTLKLTATDSSGSNCAEQTDTAPVRVNHPPIARAGEDKIAFVGGANDTLVFDGSASEDPDRDPLMFTWDFGDGNIKTGSRVFHGYASPGTYTVELTVSDGTGLPCGSTVDTLTVEVKTHDQDIQE